MTKAVIFDMDGLYINSEPLHREAWNISARKYGLQFDEETYSGFIGKGPINMAVHIKENGQRVDGKTPEEIWYEKKTVLEGLMHKVKVRDGARELAVKLGKKYKTGIASSSEKKLIEQFLDATDSTQLFSFTAGGDEVEELKPAPDVYLLAAKRAGVEPEECLALEDSPVGAESAKNAGMRCIAVPSEYTRGRDFGDVVVVRDFGEAEEIIRKL